MIRVSIEITSDRGEERCDIMLREGDSLSDLGAAIGRAIGGVWNAVEFCSGDELREGMDEFLPDEFRMVRESKQ